MVQEIDFPSNTLLNGKESQYFFRDSYQLSSSTPHYQAKHIYHGIFGFLPKPAIWMMKLRNAFMKWFGYSTGNFDLNLSLENIQEGAEAGFLTIESVTDHEVVSAAYDKSMDIWISVFKLSDSEYAISTLVNLKTRGSRVYLSIIKPFHKLLVRYAIKHAIKRNRV